MVNWDRVQELRRKGWDWADIAADPKVDFHPDASAGSPARALRALYHRTGRKVEAAGVVAEASKKPRKEETERRWTLTRIMYLVAPAVGIWFLLAFVAPSPVGILVPAIPYLALVFAAVAVILVYVLYRHTEGPRWSSPLRKSVVYGVVIGLVVAGGIGLVGALIFGCPYLPPASSLSSTGGTGWNTGPLPAWQTNGAPVVFFYGATWCPYCSASSWAIYKALSEYGTVSGASLFHSSLTDVYPGTPEVILSGVSLSPKNGHGPAIDFQASEDTSNVDGTYPGTASCTQQAYVSSYASGIPFLVVNGQYVHLGTLVDPQSLAPWNYSNSGNSLSGASSVQSAVASESGTPWTFIQDQAWWTMAFIAKAVGTPVSTLASEYGWSARTTSNVENDTASLC
jgi:hypothetical protein